MIQKNEGKLKNIVQSSDVALEEMQNMQRDYGSRALREVLEENKNTAEAQAALETGKKLKGEL